MALAPDDLVRREIPIPGGEAADTDGEFQPLGRDPVGAGDTLAFDGGKEDIRDRLEKVDIIDGEAAADRRVDSDDAPGRVDRTDRDGKPAHDAVLDEERRAGEAAFGGEILDDDGLA